MFVGTIRRKPNEQKCLKKKVILEKIYESRIIENISLKRQVK